MKLRKAFTNQRSHARQRGIEFLLSFEDWLEIWKASGKLDQRGRGKSKFVMARFGDVGPYKKSNVSIISAQQNSSEGNTGKIVTEKTKALISKAHKGRVFSLESRKRMSLSGKTKVFTSEHRTALSAAMYRRLGKSE